MLEFYKGKKVLVTGHTGFKGSWLCQILKLSGASVIGYAKEAPTDPNLFEIAKIQNNIESLSGDIRNFQDLYNIFEKYKPEIVFHLAAQPIVRESYINPVYTYDVNVMGTVHVLECLRLHPCVKSAVIITSDKVYENKEWVWGYRENENLNGYDPYSNSKSCAELVVSSYKNSFFSDRQISISTARAGNVIGGGDFAKDRIIPDCIRAAEKNLPIIIRNPHAIRPFQHVIEPLAAYLLIAQKQWTNPNLQGNYNVGPDEKDSISVGELATIFCEYWGDGQEWLDQYTGGPFESNMLTLDCSKIKRTLGWQPIWNVREAVSKIVEWHKGYIQGKNTTNIMDKQIIEYFQKSEMSDT